MTTGLPSRISQNLWVQDDAEVQHYVSDNKELGWITIRGAGLGLSCDLNFEGIGNVQKFVDAATALIDEWSGRAEQEQRCDATWADSGWQCDLGNGHDGQHTHTGDDRSWTVQWYGDTGTATFTGNPAAAFAAVAAQPIGIDDSYVHPLQPRCSAAFQYRQCFLPEGHEDDHDFSSGDTGTPWVLRQHRDGPV